MTTSLIPEEHLGSSSNIQTMENCKQSLNLIMRETVEEVSVCNRHLSFQASKQLFKCEAQILLRTKKNSHQTSTLSRTHMSTMLKTHNPHPHNLSISCKMLQNERLRSSQPRTLKFKNESILQVSSETNSIKPLAVQLAHRAVVNMDQELQGGMDRIHQG